MLAPFRDKHVRGKHADRGVVRHPPKTHADWNSIVNEPDRFANAVLRPYVSNWRSQQLANRGLFREDCSALEGTAVAG